MATKQEVSVEDKLRALYNLQLIDSRIDEITSVQGELPLEIEDLDSEIAGLSTRIEKLNQDVASFETEISNRKQSIEESKELVKKYTEQQKTVRNNREFDSLTKEAEFQELEIELAEKRIKEAYAKIEHKKEVIAKTTEKLNAQQSHLDHKKSELDAILSETANEQNELNKLSEQMAEKIDNHLLVAYKRIRSNVNNGLAVVAIERGAAGGSYFTIPPQVQIEIASRKKITIDEYSGRILVDAALAEEEREKLSSIIG
ncbi:zinc ribbon domain-containing protein [Wenyingzhuangia sp. IMCC45467]